MRVKSGKAAAEAAFFLRVFVCFHQRGKARVPPPPQVHSFEPSLAFCLFGRKKKHKSKRGKINSCTGKVLNMKG